jgi:hypothetical protein
MDSWTMEKKVAVTAADLFVLLDREFRRRRPRDCTGCFMQLPYSVDPRAPSDPDWEMLLPAECGNGCVDVAEEIVGELQALYDLKPPGEELPR